MNDYWRERAQERASPEEVTRTPIGEDEQQPPQQESKMNVVIGSKTNTMIQPSNHNRCDNHHLVWTTRTIQSLKVMESCHRIWGGKQRDATKNRRKRTDGVVDCEPRTRSQYWPEEEDEPDQKMRAIPKECEPHSLIRTQLTKQIANHTENANRRARC